MAMKGVAPCEGRMTPEAFSDLASRLGSGVQVRPVLDAVQFRVGDKAFATLGWPAAGWAVVKLSRKDQGRFLGRSDAVTVEPGRRRDTGVTLVRLQGVDEDLMAEMLISAFGEVCHGGGRGQRVANSRSGLADGSRVRARREDGGGRWTPKESAPRAIN